LELGGRPQTRDLPRNQEPRRRRVRHVGRLLVTRRGRHDRANCASERPGGREGSVMTPAPVTAETVYERMRRVRLIPVIRVQDGRTALELVHRLLAADLDVIEVTTTIDGWDTIIETIRDKDPEVCVGAGTVTTPTFAARAVEVG